MRRVLLSVAIAAPAHAALHASTGQPPDNNAPKPPILVLVLGRYEHLRAAPDTTACGSARMRACPPMW